MDPTDIGLFRLAERRLAWIDQRQTVLADNIANANTPGYKARDLPSFDAALQQQDLALTTTSSVQIPGRPAGIRSEEMPANGESPNGNTVEMEDQLARMANTSSTQQMVTNLYKTYDGMFQRVLGTNG